MPSTKTRLAGRVLGGRNGTGVSASVAVARQDGMEQSVGADRVDRIDAAERNRRDGRGIRHGAGATGPAGATAPLPCAPAPRARTRLAENCGSGARCTDRAAAPTSATAATTAAGGAGHEAGAPARRRDQPSGARPRARRLAAGVRRVVQNGRPVPGLPRSVSMANTRSPLPPTNASALKPRNPISRSSRIRLGQRVQLPRLVLES